MKKIKSFLLILFICLLSSCNSQYVQTIKYEMLNDYKYFVISSYETYLEYKETLIDKKLNYESVGYKDVYDQNYFDDFGLVILNVEEISSDYIIKYKSYKVVNNSFTVNLKRKITSNVCDERMQIWTLFIKIDNNEASLINSVFTNINGEIKAIKNYEIFE